MRAAYLVVALAARAASASEGDAIAREHAAFAAVDDARWCDAATLFLEANALAPNDDLVFDAAHAAELAGDRAHAQALYIALLTADVRAIEVRGALADLQRAIAVDGAGDACGTVRIADAPPTVAAAPVTSTTEPDAAAEADALVRASFAEERAPVPTPVVARADVHDARANEAAPLGWAGVVVGGAGLAGGALVAAIGARPYVVAGLAQRERTQADAGGAAGTSSDAATRQARATHDWQLWGESALVTGAVVAGVGAAALTAGLVVVVVEP